MCLSRASRPISASCWARWIASSSHSCTLTTVSSAPSPTRISTLPACCAEPVWLSTTVARLCRPASTTVWPLPRRPSVPRRRTTTGSVSSASLGMPTYIAEAVLFQAVTAARSAGTKDCPTRSSVSGRSSSSTPAGAEVSHCTAPSSLGPGVSSDPSRSTGVKRQSSSRPLGIGKSATSYEVLRSARDWSGTKAPTGSVWACSETTVINRPLLPSAARSGGSARGRTPSAARARWAR